MKHDICDPVNQRIVARLVGREVLHCVSYLIKHLAELEPDNEVFYELCEGKAEHDFSEVTPDQWHDMGFEDEADAIAELGEAECADRLGIEPTYCEIYEHWIVTGWALEKLQAQGEVVVEDLHGLNVWGRACTGQAISMDHVWRRIADGMKILKGQENSWE